MISHCQPTIYLEPMRTCHLEAVVRVHRESFPGFFLTFLGPRFLRLLYREILATPGHAAVVAVDSGGEVTGFVAGVERPSGFYRRLVRRRWLSFAWAAMWAAARRPSIVPRLWRALGRPSDSQESESEALLMSLAVARRSAGRGVGRQLVEAFVAELRERNVATVDLTTDRDDNEGVNRFYRRLGFAVEREYVTPEGRAMLRYRRAVDPVR
jgi:ribosomal protein S18 acetylase RimI-like enzyme